VTDFNPTPLSPVYRGDMLQVIRGNVLYLATVADVLAAIDINPATNGLVFSHSDNSIYAAGVI